MAILDGDGKQLAVGEITRSTMREDRVGCVAAWSVSGVPEGASGYQVEIEGQIVQTTWMELTSDGGLAMTY